MGLVAGAGGVLAAVGAVVVGSVAGSVVVVVVALEERVVRRTVGETTADAHTAAAVAISDEGVSLLRTATERHGDGVALRVAAAHRLAPPVLSHDNSFWSRAENEFSAKWGVSSPMALGETPTLADTKADIYIYINTRTKRQEILSIFWHKNTVTPVVVAAVCVSSCNNVTMTFNSALLLAKLDLLP